MKEKSQVIYKIITFYWAHRRVKVTSQVNYIPEKDNHFQWEMEHWNCFILENRRKMWMSYKWVREKLARIVTHYERTNVGWHQTRIAKNPRPKRSLCSLTISFKQLSNRCSWETLRLWWEMRELPPPAPWWHRYSGGHLSRVGQNPEKFPWSFSALRHKL